MNDLNILVFSKDRACQLDLLLRSIKENFNSKYVTVLYKATNEFYQKGYNKIINSFPEHCWIKENNFVSELKEIVRHFNDDSFSLVFVDDEVVIRDFSIDHYLEVLNLNSDIHCISLRMHPKVNYCYTANLSNPPPKNFFGIQGFKSLLAWDWTKHDPRVDWGYPSCINSHIYRTYDFKNWIFGLPYNGVNDLEGSINMYRLNHNEFRKVMVCFHNAKTINVANNLVQTGTNRYSDKKEFSQENLNKNYLENYIISTQNLYDIIKDTPTFETDYILIKNEN